MPNVFDRHKIAYMRARDLVPNPSNARTHSPRQIEQIARSIERFGFNNPVLIDDNNKSLPAMAASAPPNCSGLTQFLRSKSII